MPKILRISKETRQLSGQRDSPNATLRERWKVVTDTQVSWQWLFRQNNIFSFNVEHPEEHGFFVHGIDPTWSKPLLWTIDYEYTPFVAQRIDPNPTARAAEISMDSQVVEQEVLWDAKNKPITTKAGEFLTGVTRKRLIYEYRVTKNLAKDPDFMDTHGCALNSDNVRIRGKNRKPRTLILQAASLSPYTVENNQRHTECSLSLLYDPLGWTERVWNRGVVELVKTRQPYITKAGEVKHKVVWTQRPIRRGTPLANVTEPVPLNDTGQAVVDYLNPDSDDVVNPETLIQLKFDTQPVLKFTGVLPLT